VPLNKSLMTRVEMAVVTATLFESAIEWNVFEVYKSAVRKWVCWTQVDQIKSTQAVSGITRAF
jgi:uncharacterized membrane protein